MHSNTAGLHIRTGLYLYRPVPVLEYYSKFSPVTEHFEVDARVDLHSLLLNNRAAHPLCCRPPKPSSSGLPLRVSLLRA